MQDNVKPSQQGIKRAASKIAKPLISDKEIDLNSVEGSAKLNLKTLAHLINKLDDEKQALQKKLEAQETENKKSLISWRQRELDLQKLIDIKELEKQREIAKNQGLATINDNLVRSSGALVISGVVSLLWLCKDFFPSLAQGFLFLAVTGALLNIVLPLLATRYNKKQIDKIKQDYQEERIPDCL